MVAGLTIVFFINRWLREQRLQRLRRQQLLDLSPSEFEQRVALLLEDLGWRQVTMRGGSGDRGVDITAERDGLRFIIQCKRYTKPVGPNYVRDLVGALQIQQADRAILVATSAFTHQSQLEARGQRVELWDDRILLQRIDEAERLRAAQQPRRNQESTLLYAGALGLNLVLAGFALLFGGGYQSATPKPKWDKPASLAQPPMRQPPTPSWQRQRLQPPPRALLPPHALPALRNRRPRHSQPQHRRQSTQPPPSLTAATCGPS